VALVDGELRLTYTQLLNRACTAAARLAELGLQPGDRIMVQLPNGWEFVVLTLACRCRDGPGQWMRDGERFVAGTVHRIADADLRASSLLPGWSRAHVVGHLARNAEALGRLAAWAHTDVETPMYRDRDQRAAEIEAASALPVEVLRRDLDRTAEDLEQALDALEDQSWRAARSGAPFPRRRSHGCGCGRSGCTPD
jgi:acyl-coenzyme A synthetase/AMP-(fatty) acid ligase